MVAKRLVIDKEEQLAAIRIDKLDSSDTSDSLAEMKIRVQYKHLTYPYLYDGETQEATRAYGPQATPLIFIFDRQRHLRYEGRIDNTYRIESVKTNDARNTIDALLANRPIAVTHTGVFGCSTKWKEKSAASEATLQKIDQQPVILGIGHEGRPSKAPHESNPRVDTHRLLGHLVRLMRCRVGRLQDTLRMNSDRGFSLVAVSANMPDEKTGVLRFLDKKHATSRNLLFASNDISAMQAAFDPKGNSAVPYTILLSADGRVLYKQLGTVDMLELRRTILANLPAEYIGFARYWQTK